MSALVPISMVALGLCLGLQSAPAVAGSPARPELRQELLQLLDDDLRIEKEAAEAADSQTSRMAALHDRHRDRLRTVLARHGWPGWPLVGADGQQAAIKLFQRECADADLLALAVVAVRDAVARSYATNRELALMIDCSRVGQRRPQVYGTLYVTLTDGRLVRFPVEEPDKVDARRALAGFGTLRQQEEEMGLVSPPPPTVRDPRPMTRIKYLQLVTRGLNSVRYPRLRYIYIHSRDDPRAPDGERLAVPGLDIFPVGPTER